MRSLHHGPNSFRQGPHVQARELPPGQVQALDRRRTLDQQQRAYQGMHVKPGTADPGRRPPS
ncbi:hypothetical protein [Planctomyces sp. SH-PL62]|uniref:hypothetical protein n=1 Tax=Planctomyces sp. SH-PL62 TaxID=1636152 RepID=UPI00078BD07B|nr:hypothetical protein [Planctomyces sp. SH-PL62]AMV37495.1 hypothetical protein VT85_08670 [Planctomyces sp. SH-PL62]